MLFQSLTGLSQLCNLWLFHRQREPERTVTQLLSIPFDPLELPRLHEAIAIIFHPNGMLFFLCVWLFGMPKLAFLVISWFCFCDMQLFFSGSPVARQCAERRIAEVVHVWASAQKRKVFLLVSVKRKDEGILPVQRGALLAGAAGAWLLYQKPGT